jgi:VIT1/CCC1 family predicted Fe2+/Mn2+ transporter
MACECFAFAFAFALGSILHILAIVFAHIEFTKFLMMVFTPITFFITLYIIVNLCQGSIFNRALVMISQCKLIMLFFLEEIMNKI